MLRNLVGLGVLLAVMAFLSADSFAGAKQNQMVKGTIKSVDVDRSVLVINQKVKNEVVDRELSITADTAFAIGAKEVSGKLGLRELENKIGAAVQVKCDKDVNVLKVSVK